MHRKYTRFLLFSAVFLQKVTSKLSNDVLLTIHSDQDIDLLHLAALYNLTHIHSLDNKNHHFQLDNSPRRLKRSVDGDHFLFKNEIYSLEVLPTKSRNFRNRNNDLLFSRPKTRFRRQTDSSPFGEPPSVIGLDYREGILNFEHDSR